MIGSARGGARAPGPPHGLGAAADRDPDGELILDGPRPDDRVLEGRAVLSLPGHALAVADREQQLELLAEQLVVVAPVVAEQRERFDERASSRHDLRSTARDQVD